MAKGPFKISKRRRTHILDGDLTGGGHGPGRKIKGKSEFPPTLTDQEIIDGIEAILNDANNYPNGKIPKAGPTIVLIGTIKGVRTIVVADPAKRDAKTAWPDGIPRNP